ncbi:actin-like protein 7B [Heterocephalus glaber]|uniref:Actin-like protein 7B n=1 Tax=Heterocephalus glaber TaxID=10181 RepID=A0A0P6JCY6_HETGA|nr:actin-like protein 7B [Heterocephalus glaber]
MATKNSPSPTPMGTAQGDPGVVGTLPGPDADIRNTASTTEQMKPGKVRKLKALIIDLGSQYCKCGYAGEQRPTYFISSTVGKRSHEAMVDAGDTGDTRKETYVGHELLNIEAPLKLVNPLKHGIVVDWDCVQNIWEYIFHTAMKICPEEHAMLVSDPPLSPSSNREKYAELLFETFGIPAMHVASQAQLSIYSYGRTTGLVVESGHRVSHVVPICQGDMLPGMTSRADYAGSDLTNYLMQLLNEAGHKFTDDHLHIIEHIKKKCCYAALLPEEEQLDLEGLRLDYELPDGKVITISQERFHCSEMLFKPALAGCSQPSLPALTAACLDSCQEAGFREEMATNVLLCGGCTMLDGFPERFQRELSLLCPEDSPIVTAGPERKTSVWTGGSILASLEAFQQLWVSKEEFEERGGAAIYTKC